MINPIQLQGIWNDGYALDQHVVSSTFTGEDAFGHPQYDTIRTPIGEALYQFKYRNDYVVLDEILKLAQPFLNNWDAIKDVDVVLPVPPSNKNRAYQPALEITRTIAEYIKKPYSEDVLVKTNADESKNKDADGKKNCTGFIMQQRPAKRSCKILLIDDLFQSGATATECVRILKQDSLINSVYFLAITKTARESDLL
jgi:predicted amidophosphoribosyltransferase